MKRLCTPVQGRRRLRTGGFELLHSAETEAELKKLEEADSDTRFLCEARSEQDSFRGVNDAVKLVLTLRT